jgi:hypothetical protein
MRASTASLLLSLPLVVGSVVLVVVVPLEDEEASD